MSFSTKAPFITFTTPLQNATGRMQYTLTNDYMFRALLQSSKGTLKGIVCAAAGLNPQQIKSVKIMNPIELGKSIEAKDFILDVRVLLNDDTVINLEMQVFNLGNWPERSLGYLCRSFDNLGRGQDYIETKTVIQVCFLDFTLFPEAPEFFSTYMFKNVKNNVIFSDKLKLFVVDLTRIDMATEEDKACGIDRWARLFKATTWEEIKMLSSTDSSLAEAAETAYQLSAEEMIRMQCEAREDYYRQQRYIQKKMKRLEELQQSNAEKDDEIARLKAQLSKLQEK